MLNDLELNLHLKEVPLGTEVLSVRNTMKLEELGELKINLSVMESIQRARNKVCVYLFPLFAPSLNSCETFALFAPSLWVASPCHSFSQFRDQIQAVMWRL